MGADTFICGECQTTFHDINAFMKHKNSNCRKDSELSSSDQAADVVNQETGVQQVEVTDSQGDGHHTVLQMVDDTGQAQTIQIVGSDEQAVHIVPGGQEFQLLEANEGGHQIHVVETTDEDGGRHYQILGDDENSALQVLGSSVPAGGTVQVVRLATDEVHGAVVSAGTDLNTAQPGTVGSVPPGIELVPVLTEENGRPELQLVVKNSDGQTLVHESISTRPQQARSFDPRKKRAGRPRKGMDRLLPPESKTPIKEEKPTEPVKDKNGKLSCPKCKKTFGRLRHFKTHRCLAIGDYGVLSDEEEEEDMNDQTPDYKPHRVEIEEARMEEKEETAVIAKEPSVPIKDSPRKSDENVVKKGRGRPPKVYRLRGPDGKVYDKGTEDLFDGQNLIPLNMPPPDAIVPRDDPSKVQDEIEPKGVVMVDPLSNDGVPSKLKIVRSEAKQTDVVEQSVTASVEAKDTARDMLEIPQGINTQGAVTGDDPMIAGQQPIATGEEMGLTPLSVEQTNPDIQDFGSTIITKAMIPDLPVFTSEEEKIAFEETLNQVDMTQCDHLFNVHVIHQDINENSPVNLSRVTNELNVYTCTTCNKVFKMLSHVRNHVLMHTDLKPFACRLCEYATNNKGNLYTHMRRHTGQLFRCSKCAFSTCNKSHLVEHLKTHTRSKQTCRLCNKEYTTEKSLINHIRKYHKGEKGQEYLGEFQGKQQKGPAVLHQCHVCNRKFKKKIDRDRHLFIHNIKLNDNIHQCDICDYTASRRIYLEKHFHRHRVVYICCECGQKFASTIKLTSHLSAAHGCGDLDDTWLDMFTRCIESSLFQPEPDAPIRTVAIVKQTPAGTELATVPETSLSAGLHKGPSENARASELLRHMMRSTMRSKSQDSVTVPTTLVEKKLAVKKNVKPETKSEEKASQESNETEKENSEKAEEPEIVENEEESNSDAAKALEQKSNYNIYDRLEFIPMTMDIFHRLRQAFGNEECEYCGKLYYSRNDCQLHIKTHTGDKPFHCDQCSYKSITRDQLKRHIEREHENIKYVCHQCEYVAPSRTNLWHHQQKHKRAQVMECPVCSERFESAKRLKIHMEFKHPEVPSAQTAKILNASHKTNGKLGRKSFRCPYCDKQFVRGSSELQKHIWIHEGIKPYKCPLCPYACRSKSNLTNHLLRHSAEKPFLCIHCGKAYKSKTALRWHVRSHKEGKMKCSKCDYEATQRSHLIRHMETHNVMKRYQCQHCDFSANTLGYIKIHYTRNHEGCTYTHNPETTNQPPVNTETKVYKCLSCDYLFGNLADMKRHLKIRHHVQVDNLQLLEEDTGQVTQVVPDPGDSAVAMQVGGDNVPPASGPTVQVSDSGSLPTAEEDATSALQALQYAVPPRTHQERTVDVLQQILGLAQQVGGVGTNQPITVQANDGQMVELNPDTIIVQQNENGEVVLTSSDSTDEQHGQYVIQYIDEDQNVTEQQVQNEVVHMTSHEEEDAVQTIIHSENVVASTEQVQVVDESGNMVITKEGDAVENIHETDVSTKVIQVVQQNEEPDLSHATEEVAMEVE